MQVHQFLKIKFVLIFSFFTITVQSQEKSRLYFDANWKLSNKENHAFYRPIPLKEVGELVLIEDFYKNGNRQMQGYALKEDQQIYVGDIYWYDENGMDSNYSQYYNTTNNQELTYYYPEGKVWKKVHFKNDVKDGNTIIYKKDGTVLMTSNYQKGNPLSGDFIKVKNADNYYGDSLLEDTEYERTAAVTVAPARIVVDTDDKEVEKEELHVLFEKKYWLDSNQLAQVKGYKRNNYGYNELELISQKNYDKSGKLLQDLKKGNLKYGYQITNGTDYEYYTQNDFATGIKNITPYVNEQISGKVISYLSDEKLSSTTNYNKGYKDGESLEYDALGILLKKLVYKDDKPFDGYFSIPFDRDIIIESTYKNGLQEGESIAKTKSDAVIAKGIYKNGKPFQGVFFIKNTNSYRDDKYEIINVVNFEKEGKQTIYEYDYLQPLETYTLKNGKKNGESLFYDNEKIVSTIIYKDNEPYEGVLTEKNKITTYKNGELLQQVMKKDYQSENQKITHRFKGKQLTEVVYANQFLLLDNPQEVYSGSYKNGKPYDGYFQGEGEFKTVQYYEKGEIKNEYSNDYLKNMDRYQFPEYDLKSTYKDGKVFDGMEYRKESKTYITKNWKKGVLQTIDWDLFAVHYFNRIHFALVKDKIEISELKSQGKIIIEEKNNKLVKSLLLNDKVISSNTINRIAINDPLPISASRIYFLKENPIVALDINYQSMEQPISEDNEGNNLDILFKIYSNLIYDKYTVKDYFAEIMTAFDSEEKYINFLSFKGGSEDDDGIIGVQTNEKAQVNMGIQLTENANNNYNLHLFYNNKSIEFVKEIPFENLKSETKRLTKILDSKFNK